MVRWLGVGMAVAVLGTVGAPPAEAGPPRQPAGAVLEVTVPEAVGGKVVVGNLAVDEQNGAGFVTGFACGEPRPVASDLNFVPGAPTSNRFIGRANADGRLCFAANVPVHLIFDVTGVLDDVTPFPNRRTDTRDGSGAPVTGGQILQVTIPEAIGGKTVIGNLAADGQTQAGFVVGFPCGSPAPLASDLNFPARGAVSNRFVGQASLDGRICFRPSVTTHLVFDANGILGGATPIAPQRTDTRARGDEPRDWLRPLRVTIPDAAGGKVVVGNLAADPLGFAGFVTVGPCLGGGIDAVNGSELNYPARGAVSNRFIGRANQAGEICFLASATTHLVFDAQAVLSGLTTIPTRRTDTRTRAPVPPCTTEQLTVAATPRDTIDRNTRVDVTVTNNGPACDLGSYPHVRANAPASSTAEIAVDSDEGTFFGEPVPVSSITTGESLVVILAGNEACPLYVDGGRWRPSRIVLTTTAGARLVVMGADLDLVCGVDVSRFGALPESLQPGYQRDVGADWRLLHREHQGGGERRFWYDVDVSLNASRYVAEWRAAGLGGEPPPVDFGTEIVVHLVLAYDTCGNATFSGFWHDAILIPLFDRPGVGFSCLPPTGPLEPEHWVVAVTRSSLPPTPFQVNLGLPFCPLQDGDVCAVDVRRL